MKKSRKRKPLVKNFGEVKKDPNSIDEENIFRKGRKQIPMPPNNSNQINTQSVEAINRTTMEKEIIEEEEEEEQVHEVVEKTIQNDEPRNDYDRQTPIKKKKKRKLSEKQLAVLAAGRKKSLEVRRLKAEAKKLEKQKILAERKSRQTTNLEKSIKRKEEYDRARTTVYNHNSKQNITGMTKDKFFNYMDEWYMGKRQWKNDTKKKKQAVRRQQQPIQQPIQQQQYRYVAGTQYQGLSKKRYNRRPYGFNAGL